MNKTPQKHFRWKGMADELAIIYSLQEIFPKIRDIPLHESTFLQNSNILKAHVNLDAMLSMRNCVTCI